MSEGLLSLPRALRERGVPCGTERVVDFVRALGVLGPEELYWAGRLTLLGRAEDIPVYDEVFFARAGEAPPPRPPLLRAEAGRRGAHGPPGSVGAAGVDEVLRRKSFEELTAEERARAGELIAKLGATFPRRRSRRVRPAGTGPRPDLPATLRRSLRTHGEPLERRWRTRRTIARRVVLVLDVSGSMRHYARPLARFGHALRRAGGEVEAFAFGTRLTRITPAVGLRDADAALRELAALVPDWEGGTRIGDCLTELIDGWGRRGPLRGALVVICSDGLERGDPARLGEAMLRLRLLAHRVVWVNPLKGDPAYEPLARGMAAALPHVDVFLPGHDLASLEELAGVMAEAV